MSPPYTRYAIYYLPPPGPLEDFGDAWLGWSVAHGAPAIPFDIPGLAEATEAPRKYGFHATLKPPFRLRDGQDRDALLSATADLAAATSPAKSAGLKLAPLGRFLALVPGQDTAEINRVASTFVTKLDTFRAPTPADELARRRAGRLTPEQDGMLVAWGYPYVLECFRFHMTLTARLPKADLPKWMQTASGHLPTLPDTFHLDEIALVGERPDSMFECIERFKLSG